MKSLLIVLLAVSSLTGCKKVISDDLSLTPTEEVQSTPVPLPPYKWTKITLNNLNMYPYSWADCPNLVMKVNETDVYLMTGSLFDHLYKFNVSTKRFHCYETSEPNHTDFTMFSVGFRFLFPYNNKIYLGLMPPGEGFNSTYMNSMDPVTGDGNDETTFPGNTPSDMISFAVGNKGYVVAAEVGASPRQVWEYDVVSKVWTNRGNFPLGKRKDPAVFVVNSKVYIGLGYVSNVINGITVKAYVKDWMEYNPATGATVPKANFPGIGRERVKGFLISDNVYMGLGKGPNGVLNDFWKYNPTADSWSQQDSWPGTYNSTVNNIACFSQGSSGYLVKAGLNEFWKFSRSTFVASGLN